MDRVKLLAAGAIVLLFSVLSVTPVLCDDCAEGFDQWPNHGGGLLNRREAQKEHKIKSVTSLSLKWTVPTNYDVSSTPSIDARSGAVYFSSWDGKVRSIIWKIYWSSGVAGNLG
ncbi:unnamed protein product [Calypogeia fissa]